MMTAKPSLIFKTVMVRLFSMACLTALLPGNALALHEVKISHVQADQIDSDTYRVKAIVTNQSDTMREVIVRAQITFYNRNSPAGDVPAALLRKDVTHYLKQGERKPIEVRLINEGNLIQGAVRMEPLVRLRRQREWNY